ncbi:hypothetical protein Amal_01763 [Acetobacter malorum]|uniref:Uncharacterized protein n=1 Tax=Acetobacter malorum TaxID=178901 RepID=A0A177G6S2_9PROT|nr:hypothetical protein Amal_01763 [Acetobacter malorum]
MAAYGDIGAAVLAVIAGAFALAFAIERGRKKNDPFG